MYHKLALRILKANVPNMQICLVGSIIKAIRHYGVKSAELDPLVTLAEKKCAAAPPAK